MKTCTKSKLRFLFSLSLAFVAFGGIQLRAPKPTIPARETSAPWSAVGAVTNVGASQTAWDIHHSSGGQGVVIAAAGRSPETPLSAQKGTSDWADDLPSAQP
jgi:hypothetical protein